MSYVGTGEELKYLEFVEYVSNGNRYERRLKDDAPEWARKQFEIAKNKKRQDIEDYRSGKFKTE